MERLSLVLAADGRKRVDAILTHELRRRFPDLTLGRRAVKDWFQSGRVHCAGRRLSSGWVPEPGQHVLEIDAFDPVALRQRIAARAAPTGPFVPIVFENDCVLVLDKPDGTPSAPHSGEETDTAVNSALASCPSLPEVGNSMLEPGLLHRLDTATRGLLAFAKTPAEFRRLRRLWKSREVVKLYRARVASRPLVKRMEFPLGHSRKSASRMVALRSGSDRLRIRGRALPALTEILDVVDEGPARFLLTLRIRSGVMHQIRCHLAAAGCPVMGDSVYGGESGPRLELQAWKLSLPMDGSPCARDGIVEVHSRLD